MLGIRRILASQINRFRPPYDTTNWLRVVQIRSWKDHLAKIGANVDILEISPGWNEMWKNSPSRSYTSVDFPEFDVARDRLPTQFDIVIADQVLEHILDVDAAMQNIVAMTKPGGHIMIATPFLFRVHGRPHDFRRWTEPGLRHLVSSAGIADEDIKSFSWGNQACVSAHIGGPVQDFGRGRDLTNDPEYPIMVWAFARKPAHSPA